jgi:hypothetical protein
VVLVGQAVVVVLQDRAAQEIRRHKVHLKEIPEATVPQAEILGVEAAAELEGLEEMVVQMVALEELA